MSIPPLFAEGIRRFNAGEFFEAHEAFEEMLNEVDDDRWDLLLALIQVAVGYHKAANGYVGAGRMLRLGGEKLAELPASAFGIDVGALRERVGEDLARLERGEPLDVVGAPPRIAPAG